MNFRKGKSIKSRQTWFTGLLCCVFNINLHSDVLTTNCIIGKHLLTNDSEKTEQTSIVLCIDSICHCSNYMCFFIFFCLL